MKGIERLPNGKLRVRWRRGGVHHSKTFERGEAKLAKAFKEEVSRAKRLGYLPELMASERTIGEVAAAWWAAHGSKKAPRTSELYSQLLHGHVLPTFDAMRLGEVGVAEIEAWLADLDTGPVAKRNALGILGQVFNYAVRAGYMQGNPVHVAQKPKAPDTAPIKPPAPLEVERIRKALFDLDKPGDAFMVGFMAYAGPRSQELRDLQWDDIRDRTVLLRSSKTGRHRAVRLLGPLAADLAAWKLQSFSPNFGESRTTTKVVFPTPTGLPFTKATWDNWRNRAWEKVVPPGTPPPSKLRHAFVSLLIRDPSYSRAEIAEQAGHNLQTQSERYAHVFAELEGTGSAEDAIRAARAEVFGDERQEAV